MGSYDGAEVCELVGLYMLHLLSQRLGIDFVGLYRDDGATAQILSKKQADRTRKDIIAIFKSCGFTITVEINLPRKDMLDVTFDLPSGKYWPYRKPNNEPLYIHSKSNHPPSILKHLPKNINDRLSSISCDEAEFDKAKPAYEQALKNSGFNNNNFIHYKVRDRITYPLPNFNDATVKVWEWISNFTPHLTWNVIIYPSWDYGQKGVM